MVPDERAYDGAHGAHELEQARLQHLGHLVQVVGGPAHHLAGLMRVVELERQAIELLGDARAQRQVELLGEARHDKALHRVQRAGGRPDAEVYGELAAAGVPSDREHAPLGERDLDIGPQHVDHVRTVGGGRHVETRVDQDRGHHHAETPALAAGGAPQAAHRAPGVSRDLELFLGRARAIGHGLGVLDGALATLALYAGVLGEQLVGSVVALLLGPRHATHLPSSGCLRSRDTPRSSP